MTSLRHRLGSRTWRRGGARPKLSGVQSTASASVARGDAGVLDDASTFVEELGLTRRDDSAVLECDLQRGLDNQFTAVGAGRAVSLHS
jgi:hypothetical protein